MNNQVCFLYKKQTVSVNGFECDIVKSEQVIFNRNQQIDMPSMNNGAFLSVKKILVNGQDFQIPNYEKVDSSGFYGSTILYTLLLKINVKCKY